MGVFSQTMTLITFVVQPLPPGLAVKWIGAGLAQGVLMGVLVHCLRPKPAGVRAAA